jgi:hypothetical protein
MTRGLLCCALGASLIGVTSPARADDQPSVALLVVTPGPGVVKSEATAAETALVKELTKGGQVHVMPRAEAEAALDVGHRKQLAKCRKDVTCLAEVAGVLQAELAATIEIAHVAKGTSLTLTVVAVKTSRELAHLQKTFKAKTELAPTVTAIAEEFSSAFTSSAEFGAPPPEPPHTVSRRKAQPAAPAEEPEAEVAPTPKKRAAPAPADEEEEKAIARPAPAAAEPAPAPSGPVRTSNGFVLGFEFGYGPWGVDPSKIVAGAAPGSLPAEGYTMQDTAAAFTNPMNNQWRPALNLHLGWNILGYGSLEGVFQMSWWDVFATSRGGTGLVGGRATIYPLQFFLPNRSFDVGIEGGGGYTIAGGPTFGMDGTYASFGVTGEYYLGRNISIGLFYRLFLPMWNRFYVDYNNHVNFAVNGFSGSWNTLGIGVNFHVSP